MCMNNLAPYGQRAVDSLAPIWKLEKNGIYKVGSDFFNHKINALKAATVSGQQIQWQFNDMIWNTLDWKHDDGLPVTHWYAERARQIRDTYDYVILAFSGGADSNNISNVCMSAGIHIDEVWIDWPISHTQDYKQNFSDLSPSNMPSEWNYAIKPQLDYISQNTDWKITVTDSTADMSDEDYEDTLVISQYSYYATVKRFKAMDDIIKKHQSQGKTVGVIFGIEIPNFAIVNDILCIYFSDDWLQIKTDYNNDLERNIEYFYWASDLPQLVRSQCHTFLKYLRSNPDLISNCFQGSLTKNQTISLTNSTPDILELQRQMLKKAIYPYWNQSYFQVAKPRNKLYHNEFYDWLPKKFGNHRALQSHRSCLDNTIASLAPDLLKIDKGQITTFRSFHSRYYPIGRITDLASVRR
jgi:hypothetical protein